jgi:hypothetical protein
MEVIESFIPFFSHVLSHGSNAYMESPFNPFVSKRSFVAMSLARCGESATTWSSVSSLVDPHIFSSRPLSASMWIRCPCCPFFDPFQHSHFSCILYSLDDAAIFASSHITTRVNKVAQKIGSLLPNCTTTQ